MARTHEISLQDANKEIIRFLELKTEINKLEALTQLSEAAQRLLKANTLSIIFHRDQIDSLMNEAKANAYRIYFAANQYGEPSLIIVPCNINPEETAGQNIIMQARPPAGQYGLVRPIPPPPPQSIFDLTYDNIESPGQTSY